MAYNRLVTWCAGTVCRLSVPPGTVSNRMGDHTALMTLYMPIDSVFRPLQFLLIGLYYDDEKMLSFTLAYIYTYAIKIFDENTENNKYLPHLGTLVHIMFTCIYKRIIRSFGVRKAMKFSMTKNFAMGPFYRETFNSVPATRQRFSVLVKHNNDNAYIYNLIMCKSVEIRVTFSMYVFSSLICAHMIYRYMMYDV